MTIICQSCEEIITESEQPSLINGKLYHSYCEPHDIIKRKLPKIICDSCGKEITYKNFQLGMVVAIEDKVYHMNCERKPKPKQDKDTNDVMSYNVGHSNYATKKIQPWDIWEAYKGLDPWRLDMVKRLLRTKKSDTPILDIKKLKHICDKLIDLYENSDYFEEEIKMIECYFKWCKNHCFNSNPDEGPFCNEMECTATDKEIKEWTLLREEELKQWRAKNEKCSQCLRNNPTMRE